MSYEKKTISTIIEDIDNKKIFLPAIQRKYVWKEEQIIKLMDSILRGYPFGTFLFWKVKKNTVNNKGYSLYEFIKDYHERDNYKNKSIGNPPFIINETNKDDTVLSALDGQQRLTSLYIALKGSLSLKIPKRHWSNDDAFPKKELYFDLHSTPKEENELAYRFAFLTQSEAENSNNELWYCVKDIIRYPDFTDVTDMLYEKGWISDRIALANISRLFSQLKKEALINYFEVDSDSIDDVLDIFVRVNSGGTVLSKTDLLFSTIVSYWDSGRDEIDTLLSTVNKIGDGYSFNNDFIMRACLYVMDLSTKLKVENFGKDSVEKIKSNWNRIKESIKATVDLLNDLGFNSENIVADNSILPIIYYRYMCGNNAFIDDNKAKVRFELRKYLVISQIKHIFGQSTNTTLSTIRSELKKHTGEKFVLSSLQDLSFSGDRSLKYNTDDLEKWFDEYEKNAYTFMLLSLLYPNLKYGQNGFHQDHMHPYSSFDKDNDLLSISFSDGSEMDDERMKQWRHQRNTLANLQLLEGRENESKNDTPLEEWLDNPSNKENVKYLPVDTDYSLANFEQFIEKRKELMIIELKRILSL